MRLRFPLYAKIVLWFFLNLVLLAGAAWVLVQADLDLGLDSVLLSYGEHRVQAMTDAVLAELRERPRDEWAEVLRRQGAAYGLDLRLYQNNGVQLAGPTILLPEPVIDKLLEQPPGRLGPPGENPRPPLNEADLAGAPGPPPEGGPGLSGASEERHGPGSRRPGPPGFGSTRRQIVRVAKSPHYWLLARAILDMPQRPHIPVTFIASSDSIGFNGLLFDLRPWLLAVGGASLISALLWLPLVQTFTRSIRQMTNATRQIAEGDFDVRVGERRRDELGSLGRSINLMASRLAGFVTGQKRFLGDVAHELCSPLARVQVALGILEQRANEHQQPYVSDLREEVQHISSLVNELLSFSRASLGRSTIKLKPVCVREIAAQAIARENMDGAEIRLEVDGGLYALAEPELLTRSLSNLLRNAGRYAGQAGPITVSAKHEGEEVWLRVTDCGPGVPEAELEHIFEPFYRVDASRTATTGGVGLGLAIVKTCVESCQGKVACHNRQPSGLEVILRLPAAEAGSESRSTTEGLDLDQGPPE